MINKPLSNGAEMPLTKNQDWGFWGEMKERAEEAWPLAVTAISADTREPWDVAANFLDSRQGRHFASDVHYFIDRGLPILEAIESAIQKWQGWKISKDISRDYGIPVGLPYLTGFVIHAGILSESD